MDQYEQWLTFDPTDTGYNRVVVTLNIWTLLLSITHITHPSVGHDAGRGRTRDIGLTIKRGTPPCFLPGTLTNQA